MPELDELLMRAQPPKRAILAGRPCRTSGSARCSLPCSQLRPTPAGSRPWEALKECSNAQISWLRISLHSSAALPGRTRSQVKRSPFTHQILLTASFQAQCCGARARNIAAATVAVDAMRGTARNRPAGRRLTHESRADSGTEGVAGGADAGLRRRPVSRPHPLCPQGESNPCSHLERVVS